MTRAVQDLSGKLKRYMKLNAAQGDWGDEEEEGDEEEIVDDQDFLDQIFAEYGMPANRKTEY
jgi:hypothetical protein